MQVVGSSRISNTIYLTVGSVYWTLFLQNSGIPLDISIETALVIIPIAAMFGTVLWAMQPERRIIEAIIFAYAKRSRRGRMTRLWMARSYLLILPWESTYDFQPPIKDLHKREVSRVIHSSILKEELEDVFQLFWLVVITPPLVFLLSVSIPIIQGYALFGGALFIALVTVPILYRKRRLLKTILQISFFRWLSETIYRDKENRRTNPEFLQYPEELVQSRDGLEISTSRLIDLALLKDWEGFTLNVEHLEPLLDEKLPKILTGLQYDRIIQFNIWWVKSGLQDAIPYNTIDVGSRMIEDCIDILNQPYEVYRFEELKESESGFFKRLKSIFIDPESKKSMRLDKGLQEMEAGIRFLNKEREIDYEPLRVYQILTKDTFSELDSKTIQEICLLPYLLNEREISSETRIIAENVSTPSEFVGFLLEAIEVRIGRKYSDRISESVVKIFLSIPSLAHRLSVDPREYYSSCGPLTIGRFLEDDIGQTAEQILRWMQEIIEEAETLDYKKCTELIFSKFDETDFESLIKNLDSVALYGSDKEKERIFSIEEGILRQLDISENLSDAKSLKLKGIYHIAKGEMEMARKVFLDAAKYDKDSIKYLIELTREMIGPYLYNEDACTFSKKVLALCEENDKYYGEVTDLVERACEKPTEDDIYNDY